MRFSLIVNCTLRAISSNRQLERKKNSMKLNKHCYLLKYIITSLLWCIYKFISWALLKQIKMVFLFDLWHKQNVRCTYLFFSTWQLGNFGFFHTWYISETYLEIVHCAYKRTRTYFWYYIHNQVKHDKQKRRPALSRTHSYH